MGTHGLRHTYRSWLDAVGTGIAVQQRLMRHTDIRTTMNVYADVVTDEEGQAHSKVVRMGGLAHSFYTHAILRLPHPCVFCKGGSEETLKGYPTLIFSGFAAL